MTGGPFQDSYAGVYDLLYEDKDYEAECQLLATAFDRYGVPSRGAVLDLGCGTGGHAIPLAKRGYDVTGVDHSPAMVRRARQKALASGANIALEEGDIRTLRLGRRFDACICMFAVLCYQLTNEDVEAALDTARQHLKPGGLFVFDFWYGPAVLSIRPSPRIKTIRRGPEEIIRLAQPSLDVGQHTNETVYRTLRLAGGKILDDFQEAHRVRYFFPRELDYFLRQAGLVLRDLRAFPDTDMEPDDTTWNAIAFAQVGGRLEGE